MLSRPWKGFDSFEQSTVEGRSEGDKISMSSVVVETLELPENKFYGHLIMDRTRHILTRYFSGNKTKAAIRNQHFRRLDHVNNALHKIELAQAQTEVKEPKIAGFFVLRCTKQRMLELNYYLSTKVYDVNKFNFLEMDTDSLCLASRSCWERFGRLYRAWNGSRMGAIAIKALHC